ncbi:MAG: VWA domain-containing protein [Planctomycetia bacterium]|nr:VWA domain-containing protein [Planctomycetia bacterium]
MKRYLGKQCLALLATFALLLGSTGALRAAPAGDAVPDKGKPVDLVLCLDVSGSMQGLIDSAKTKLWDIVNDLAKIKPTPNLRVALYSYGHTTYDAQAGWVRKEADLTSDLDEIYKKLNALTINGGSELVARVTRDAVEQQKWAEAKDALKIIFVCGNESANQDRQVSLADVAEKAVAKGIIINTIYCGQMSHPDAAGWKDYAKQCKGEFFSIDQDKGTVVVNTPFDKELTELSGKMSSTYLAFGKDGREKALNQVAQDANAAKAPGAGAARAESKASGLYRNAGWDLVDKLKEDPKFDVKKVPVEELCDEMKKMTPEEREAHVKKKLAEREDMQKKIADLSAKRQEYIKEEMKKNPNKADQAFDAAIRGALRQQAESKGFTTKE